ncbi:MAG TPA: CUB domain-containing protein [Bacteroidales bacterium]|nr:CUB domain-containing protein [Bacteroidales bacterium]
MKKLTFLFVLCSLSVYAFSQPAPDWNGKVMTVRGLISPDSMGITLPHEHLIIVHKYNYLDLTDENIAIEELGYFTGAGGKTVADASAIGIGRNPEKLKTISTATNTNVIMCTGYYKDQWIPDSIKCKSVEQLTDIIINDIFNGINGIHAGFIKIGISKPITDFEEKAVRAAARAQKITGAAVELHFDGDRATFAERNHVLDVIENEGADLHRVIMNHCVPYVYWVNDYITIANRGCYIAFDMIGLEVRVGYIDVLRLPETLNALIDAGYLDHLLISQDVCFSVCYVRNGGYGYGHILNDIVPELKASGITDDELHTIMVDNPKQIFPFKSTPDAGGCVSATYTTTSGNVTDNSGASDYTNNLTCSKLIQPENSGSVTLFFNSFNTEPDHDVVRVYDGETTSSPLIGQFSGNSLPPAITSSGSSMLVVFTTNGSVTRPGWSATYYGNAPVGYNGPCVNQFFAEETGVITDNSGGLNYYTNMACQKLIKVQEASGIELKFGSFATESGYDIVRVYDGETISSPLLGEFSGTSIPPDVTSSGNSMLITFTTDGGVELAGWSATYTAKLLKFRPVSDTVGANSGTTTVSVHSTVDWSPSENESWLNAVKTNDTTFSVVYDENFSLQPRSAIIMISGDGVNPCLFTINQKGAEPSISVSPDSQIVDYHEGNTQFSVVSNIEWTVNETASWLTAGKSGNNITVEFEENKTISERLAEIIVSGEGAESQVVTVTQQGGPPFLEVSPDTQTVACDTGRILFSVESNIDWFVTPETEWILAEKVNDSTILVKFTANPLVLNRNAVIWVGGEGVSSQAFVLVQSGALPALSVLPASRSVESLSGTTSFMVSSNINWNVEDKAGWLAALKQNDTTISIIFQENPDTANRSAEILVTGEGVDTVSLLVVQDGALPDPVVSEDADHSLKVYPNPVSGSAWFVYESGVAVMIALYDPAGKMIMQVNDEDSNGASEIDLSDLNPGIYIYRVTGGKGGISTGKIVKK